nr:tyrosine-protein phosphatase [Phenylobacterium sp.]
LGFYREAPHQPRHVDLFRRYFQALAETNGALVVHCAAGKDRTGLICALTHHIAGVHRDDTLADYLMTNNEARMAARIDFLRSYILDLTGKLVDDEGLRQAASVHPDYLDHGLSVISQSHGHIDNYLAEVLGVDSALRGKIEARILR